MGLLPLVLSYVSNVSEMPTHPPGPKEVEVTKEPLSMVLNKFSGGKVDGLLSTVLNHLP